MFSMFSLDRLQSLFIGVAGLGPFGLGLFGSGVDGFGEFGPGICLLKYLLMKQLL